jgi:hypothetical protein
MALSNQRLLIHLDDCLTRRMLLQTSLLSGTLLLVGCSRSEGPSRSTAGLVAWPSDYLWPPEVERSPSEVREAYKFAVSNYETLQWMPCFCGCVSGGHRNNFDCYVRDVRDDGSVALDAMSFG